MMTSVRVLALSSVLSLCLACSGRTTKSAAPAAAAGAAGSVSTAGAGGASSGGASSGGASSGGEDNMAGAAGESPSGCGYTPEGPAAQAGSLAPPAEVWRRIGLFLADDEVPPPADLPSVTTASWAGDAALRLVDAFLADDVVPAGLTSFFAAWMPELEDPSRWALLAAQEPATMSDLLTFSRSTPAGPAFGILTDRGFLTSKTNIGTRGAWMYERLYCAGLPPPPMDFPPPVEMPNMTSREEYETTLGDPSCAGCHVLIDPLGFSLEHFDALGIYRDLDDGLPVDSSGSFTTPEGGNVSFTSIRDLAPALASCEVAACWSMRLYDVASERAGRAPSDGIMTPDMNRVVNRMSDANFSMRELIRAIVVSPSFLQP